MAFFCLNLNNYENILNLCERHNKVRILKKINFLYQREMMSFNQNRSKTNLPLQNDPAPK